MAEPARRQEAPRTEATVVRLTRAERKQRTRRALLDAARSVVARRGMQAATHEEIAAEAGLTIGAIYSNFTGKADLMAALMDDVAAHSSVRLEVRPTLQECLEALAQRIVEQVDTDPEAVDLSLEFALFAVREPEARERRLPHWDVEHDHHATVLQRVSDMSGEPLPTEARRLAEAVSHLAWSLMCSRRIMGPDVVTTEAIFSALQLLASRHP